jgi:hypothetical protein
MADFLLNVLALVIAGIILELLKRKR